MHAAQPAGHRSAEGTNGYTKYNTFCTCHSSEPPYLQQPSWYMPSFQPEYTKTFPSRQIQQHVRLDATRRRFFLFLLCNRNARYSSTSGSNLLPVRLHQAIDNGAATTTSHYVHVRSCFLSIVRVFVSTDLFFLFFYFFFDHVPFISSH